MKNILRNIALAATLSMLLGGCSALDDMFTSSEPPLPGERISILQLQKELTPNPELQNTPIELPDAWQNKLWPQAGGYPTHAMGHLALGTEIKKAWSVSIGAGGSDRTPLTALPVVADGKVFTLDTDGDVTAFNLKDGKKLWRQSIVPDEEDDGAIGGGISYASGMLYVSGGYRQLIALDTETGKPAWRIPLPAPGRAAPTVIDGRIFMVTLDNNLMVFTASDGAPLWKYSGISENTNLLGSASVAADQSMVILPLSSGELFGLNPVNGQVAWQDNLSAIRKTGPLSSISDIRGLPVIDQGLVYAASYSGRMIVSDSATGQRLWQREIGSAETPWPAGNAVFIITTEQQLASLDRQSGGTRWVTQLSAFEDEKRNKPVVWAGPILAGGRLFTVSSAGKMDEIDPQSGKIIKQHDISSGATLSPIVVDDTLLVLTENGTLTAYR